MRHGLVVLLIRSCAFEEILFQVITCHLLAVIFNYLILILIFVGISVSWPRPFSFNGNGLG